MFAEILFGMLLLCTYCSGNEARVIGEHVARETTALENQKKQQLHDEKW